MKLAQDIIIKPIITEKSMDLTADKKYVFKVAKDAEFSMESNPATVNFENLRRLRSGTARPVRRRAACPFYAPQPRLG